MNLGEKLKESITAHNVFDIYVFGHKIPVSDTVINMWIIMAVLIIMAVILSRNLQRIPKGKQNVAEMVVGFFNSFTEGIIGHHWRVFAPYLGTVALFLVFANTISIFNIIPSAKELYELTHIQFFENVPEFHIKPPTKDINVTVALAAMSMVVVIAGTIRVKKVSGWLKSFVHPMPIVIPFKVLDYLIRPTSLSLRLFGNIMGAFIVMELVYLALPAVLPAALSIYFDLFDGILQAYVFMFLTSFYIAETIE